MTTRFLFVCCLLVGWAPALAGAQAPPDTVVVSAGLDSVLALPNVTVEAQRTRVSTRAAGMRVTTLGPDVIEATSARTVADLLAARTGLFVKRYGEGGLATASLRGTNSTQTLVLVDGQRVADPQSGQVDLSLLPTVLLESVDVLHGAHAARYGSDGIGGVVRLHTLQPTTDWRVRTMGRLGAFGAQSAGAVASGGLGRMTALVATEVSRSERDFPYENETLFPSQTQRRRGADRTLATVFSKVRYDGPQHQLGVSGWFNDVERGLPGVSNAAPSGARQWDTHRRLFADYRTAFGASVLTVDARVQQSALRYVNPSTRTQTSAQTRSYGLSAQLQTLLSPRWSIQSGLDLGSAAADLRGGVHRATLGGFVRGTGTYGRVRVLPAVRVDRHQTAEGASNLTALSPQLGLNVQPLPWGGFRLKAQAGRAFRAPTFNERFYVPGGNPDLTAERGWSAEVGAVVSGSRGRVAGQLEGTAFTTRIRDQIVWFPSFVGPGVQTWRPANVARVVTEGVELSAQGQARLPGAVHLDGGFYFTHTSAENRSDPATRAHGHQLRYIPRQQLKLFAGATWGPFTLDVTGRLVSERFVTSDETQALAPYQVLDVRLAATHALGPVAVTLDLTVENALDADYQVIRFYPMPPRHARLRLRFDMQP
jgi:iron complex outermembrane receptor protein